MRSVAWTGFLILCLRLLEVAPAHAALLELTDPNSTAQKRVLSNGIKVILVPSESAKTMQIKVRVGAGHFNEREGKAGTAHLLEHYLFTDAKMDRSMTYLDAIKERGGRGNATTDDKETLYFATVPPEFSEWVIEIFGKMLVDREFDEDLVQHSKKPVFLEIGRPDGMDHAIRFLSRHTPHVLTVPSFWESEFGVIEPEYTRSGARIETEGLAGQDLQEFYQLHYSPENLTLLLTGKFDSNKSLRLLERTFSKMIPRAGGGWRDPDALAKRSRYRRESFAWGVANIEIGTKFAGISLAEEVAVRAYLTHLSHRLMRELRNSKGETYGVRFHIEARKGFGRATLEFEAPDEKYYENLKYVRGLIDREARAGEISPEQFEKAKRFYLEKLSLIDRDAMSMMTIADQWEALDRNYPDRATGMTHYRALKEMQYASFLKHLKAAFPEDMPYDKLNRPPLFFRFESVFFLIAMIGFWTEVGRKLLAREFLHDQIRWVRKIDYPPAYVFEVCLVIGAIGWSTMAVAGTFRFWGWASLDNAHVFISDYLLDFIWTGEVVAVFLWIFGSPVRKLMVVDDRLIKKTMSFRSFSAKLDHIELIELIFPLALIFRPRIILKVLANFDYYSPFIWRKGILLGFKDGSYSYVGIKNPEAAIIELKAQIERAKKISESLNPAAAA